MVKKSRYIKKEDQDEVDKSSGMKCAWCGTNLKERHHIELYSEGGSNQAANLILLCPNCHKLVHKGSITKSQLLDRRLELTGTVNRSAGFLSIPQDCIIKIGSNTLINTPNIIQSNGENIITIKNNGTEMLVSLNLYDRNKNLICWMHENKWWVENEEVFDFNVSKRKFEVISREEDVKISAKIGKGIISLNGQIFLDGYEVKFDESDLIYSNPSKKVRFINSKNGVFKNCKSAFVFNY